MMVVIGGGIIGLSIAWRLAQRGLAVTVLDAGRRGGEASPAGAGMLAPGGEFTGDKIWTPLALESHALYPRFIEELSVESGRAIDYRICGALDVATSDADWSALRERAKRQIDAGIVCSEVGAGILYPGDGYVDPRHVLAALRIACDTRGVSIQDQHMIGEIASDAFRGIVIAAGAWSGSITVTFGGVALAIPPSLPVKGHLIGYDLPPGSLSKILRHGHTYILQRANGYTIAGSTEQRIGFDKHVDQAICREIHSRAIDLWPDLARYTPRDYWIGFRPATEDLAPKIGRFEDTNVWLAYGHYRNGILLAPVTAERIASQVTGENSLAAAD